MAKPKTKSFKDNYEDLRTVPTTTADEVSPDAVIITPSAPSAPPTMVEVVELDGVGLPNTETQTPIPQVQPVRVELTEEIADVLTEQREQSAKVLESVMKTNTKIANSITKFVKNSTQTNEKLVEAIVALTDKIETLEAKLDAIENIEIPTPIVNLQMPSSKIVKEVHRDKTGIITHITESNVADDEDS